MEEGPNIWDQWQELLHSENPDLLEILRLGAQFQAYFSTIESETLQAARTAGMTWAQLGEALGTSRQAVWQRATTWDASRYKQRAATGRARPGEEILANFRKAQEDWADRRDQAASAMFDSPPGSVTFRKRSS
jgi:hypothetical protein